jgi:DNA-binding NtrC family response regulator
MSATILIAEDEPVQRHLLTTLLERKLGYQVIVTTNGREAIAEVRRSNTGDIAAVLLDLNMPEMDGFEALRWLQRNHADLPVIILTGQDETAVAVTAIREGASDFIVKPPDVYRLKTALEEVIRRSELTRKLQKARQDKPQGFDQLTGKSGAFVQALIPARRAATLHVPVLLYGEAGTGKTTLARAIHADSRRRNAPFVLHYPHPQEELNLRLLRRATGGTLMLNDAGSLSPEACSLLRQLFEEAPGTLPDVRLILTSRDDPATLKQQLPPELYYQLSVLPVHLPPLRERREDIVALAEHFLRHHAQTHALPSRRLSDDAQDYLREYQWPGNLRELSSLMQRALLGGETEQLSRMELQDMLQPAPTTGSAPLPADVLCLHAADGVLKNLSVLEQEILQRSLALYDDNMARTAAALGIAKSTLYRKLKHPE